MLVKSARLLPPLLFLCAGAGLAPAAVVARTSASGPAVLKTPTAEFRITPAGYIQAFLARGGKLLTLDEPGDAALPAVSLVSAGKQIVEFRWNPARAKIGAPRGTLGKGGKRVEISGAGYGDAAGLEGSLIVEAYDDFPNIAVATFAFRNTGSAGRKIDKVVVQRHRLNASLLDPQAFPYSLWSFQGSASQWGKDEILRIPKPFDQKNPVGGPGPKGLGGGLPVADFWTAAAGVAIGHIEPLPLIASLPVQVLPDDRIDASLEFAPDVVLKPGDSYTTPRTFVAVHAGDYYEALTLWAQAVRHQSSWSLARATPQSYEANWCGWGYEADFTPEQMVGTLPKLKELGFKWATLDYRWFDNYGDWMPRTDTFPGDTLRKVVDEYHKQGILVQLWYQPISVEDGEGRHSLSKPMAVSRLIGEHPDWAILDKDGKRTRMISPVSTGAALCPALPEVREYHRRLVQRFLREWGFDGLKMDAVFTVPPCYNPRHHHQSPEDSIRAMGQVFQAIFDTAREIKPQSIIQICPCGAVPNMAWVFLQDQAVTADPVGSAQVRRRVKMYKALLGPRAAVYGDHVELSGMRRAPNGRGWIESGMDFASTVGTGGVIGTKFTWPGPPPRPRASEIQLTPEKEAHWKKWIGIYNARMLSQGTFRNLYVYGYDSPEAYAIEKDGKMYYAFFSTAEPRWKGEVELRGLRPGKYRVFDYAEGKDLGVIDARNPRLAVDFNQHLLIETSRM